MKKHFEEAIKNNQHDLVEKDLNNWQPVRANCSNEALQTGLMIACKHNSVETAELLLKTMKSDNTYNINLVDASQWTALHFSAQSGSLGCFKLIIESENDATSIKASIKARNELGQTPLHLSAAEGHLDCLKYLIEKGADLEKKFRYGGKTPLHLV